MRIDRQEQNEISRRVKQCLHDKRNPLEDLQKAQAASHQLGKKFRESRNRDGTYPSTISDQYARSLREVQICEHVLEDFNEQKVRAA